jgi:hypothetical protein
MKSFKQYLAEQEQNLFESEWNFNIPKTRMFETDQKNQDTAKKVMSLALGKGNAHAEAFEAIKAKAASGEELATGEKEIDDVLQALSVLSTIASKKNSPSYKLLPPTEAKKLLQQAGLKPDESGKFTENPAVNVGSKIISKKRKTPEPTEEEQDAPKEEPKETEKPAPEVKEPEEETPEVEEPEEETPEPDTAGSDEPSADKKETKSSDDPKKSKDVDLESENKRSPAYYSKIANDLKKEYLETLKSKKEGLDPDKAGFIDRKSLDFEKKANRLIKGIEKQQGNFSVHSTPASRLKATTTANADYTELLRLKNQIEYETGKLNRTNVLQRAGKKMQEFGQGIARGVSNLDKKTKGAQEAIGRTAKVVGEKIAQGAKTTADAVGQATKTAADSKTAQEIKAATGRVWDKVKTKASEADEKIAQGVSKIAQPKPAPVTNIEKKADEVQQVAAEEPKTAEVMKDKIETQEVDNTTANTAQAKDASKLVMDKATLNKVLPGQGHPKAPLVAKKKKEEETDEEGNIIHKSKVG